MRCCASAGAGQEAVLCIEAGWCVVRRAVMLLRKHSNLYHNQL